MKTSHHRHLSGRIAAISTGGVTTLVKKLAETALEQTKNIVNHQGLCDRAREPMPEKKKPAAMFARALQSLR
jgi:hypothetical protein